MCKKPRKHTTRKKTISQDYYLVGYVVDFPALERDIYPSNVNLELFPKQNVESLSWNKFRG